MTDRIFEIASRMRGEVTNVIGFHELLDAHPPVDAIERLSWESNFTAYSLALAKSVLELVEHFERLAKDD